MSPRILVIDDEPSIRRTLERALRSLSYDVVSVGDPQSAYELLDAGGWDLVMLDLHMPQMMGDTLFVALIRRWPEMGLRVLLTSGDPWAVNAESPAELQRCPMLPKPYTLHALAEAVASTLAAAQTGSPQRKRNGG